MLIHRVTVCALFWATVQSQAAPIVGLVSIPTDTSSLTVGQTISVSVEMTGLNPGDELDLLAATVVFDAGLFSSPTIAAGSIIPDIDGFLGLEDPGLADGSFDSFFTASGVDTITGNGVFYSFEVTALKEGSGTIDLDFSDALGTTGSGSSIDGIGIGVSSLSVNIVPEPTAGLLMLCGILAVSRIRHMTA